MEYFCIEGMFSLEYVGFLPDELNHFLERIMEGLFLFTINLYNENCNSHREIWYQVIALERRKKKEERWFFEILAS